MGRKDDTRTAKALAQEGIDDHKFILSVDPGQATGIFYCCYDDTTPLTKQGAWIVQKGPKGLASFLVDFLQNNPVDTVVSELFVPDGTAGGRETVSPRGEGVLIALFPETPIYWQLRSDKTLGMPNVRFADQKLKDLGWWVTGEDVSWTDGRDANDAALHALAYTRKIRHRPTLDWISGK